MLTEAEDHDIASNNDGLAIMRKSASTPARARCLGKHVASGPGTCSSTESRGPGEARVLDGWPRAGGRQRSAT